MSFTIVAVRHGISIFNRRASPREALFLASSRVQEGVQAVRVFGPAGEFVGASALADAARRQGGASSVHAAVNDALKDLTSLEPEPYVERDGVSIRVGAETAGSEAANETKANPEPVRTGRVRVFRAKSARD